MDGLMGMGRWSGLPLPGWILQNDCFLIGRDMNDARGEEERDGEMEECVCSPSCLLGMEDKEWKEKANVKDYLLFWIELTEKVLCLSCGRV